MLDIAKNRRAQKYSAREQVKRVLWSIMIPFFRLSPRPMFGFRSMLLRLFGARIGRQVHIYPSATVYFPWNLEIGDSSAIGENCLIYNLGPVTIGSRTTISHLAHLCAGTHDHTDPSLPLIKSGIEIGNDAWICSDAFIGPGVKVGEGAVVGARASVFREVQPFNIVGGNPAKIIGQRILSVRNEEYECFESL